MKIDPIDFELGRLKKLIDLIYLETSDLLEVARDEGSVQDRCKALDTAMRMHSYVTSDLVRSRITKISCEAASCLSGAYEGKEVELSEWAAEACSQVELNTRAAEILKDNKSYFS